MKPRNGSLHAGHRKRMKAQFLENGLSQFNEHQKLEMLLFYSIARGDTNELAHLILNECGGRLCDVYDAPYEKLLSIKGVGEHTALFLKMLPEYLTDLLCSRQLRIDAPVLNDMEKVCSYFEGVFINIHTEEVHVAAVNAGLRLIKEKKIASGTVGSASFTPRLIMDFAITNGYDRLIIAHNHPHGTCLASKDDILVTAEIVRMFAEFDIEIVDHIIVGENGSRSMRSSVLSGAAWNQSN